MKLMHKVDKILMGNKPDEKVDHLRVIVEQLQTKLSTSCKFDDEILALCDIKDIEYEIEELEGVTTKIFTLRHFCSQCTLLTQQLNPFSPVAIKTVIIHLLKIELLKFHGNVTNWLSFWNYFNTTVHENHEISTIDKVQSS